MRFPGAKRTGKKKKGEKETELQQHNRRTTRHNERLMKHGPTKRRYERQKVTMLTRKSTKVEEIR